MAKHYLIPSGEITYEEGGRARYRAWDKKVKKRRHVDGYRLVPLRKGRLEQHGMRFCGMSPDGVLPEIIEYADHPWFI